MIVGTGAVGTTLALSLQAKDYTISAIASRSKARAQQLATHVGAPAAVALSSLDPAQAQLIFLCVPDDVLPEIADKLANHTQWAGRIVAHTSGAQTASILLPLQKAGAYAMSFHPVQTFVKPSKNAFSGIYVGIEGDEPAVSEGIVLAQALDATPLVLQAADKARYHLAASIASNFTVTLVSAACDVLESIGMQRDEAVALLRPLVMQTCTNVTTRLPEEVLTGPAARGDKNTLQQHLDALENHQPHLLPLYRALLAQTVELAKRGATSPDAKKQLDEMHSSLQPE